MNERELYIAFLKRTDKSSFQVSNFLFNKQLEFINDKAPFKTAVCSRRSGKTYACAAHLVATALSSPGTSSLYITISRNNAKKIIWPVLQEILISNRINARSDLTELSIKFENNSIIYVSGANDQAEIEKFRGLALKLVYLDECQSFRSYIEQLIDDIITPALMDYAGSLCLIGTPGPIPVGYFHDCATKHSSWSKHSWTFFDNPYIPQKSGMTHRDLLQRELDRRGVSVDDPSIQREWFGKWVLDSESLLLRYDEKKNHFDELPGGKYDYLMGIDLGFVDADAISILAWSEQDPATYLVDESIQTKQGLTELVRQIESLQAKYPVAKMVIDEGGLGKKIAEELRRRFHIPVQPADKARKMENIAFLNDALRTGRFKAKKNSRFAQDSYLVEIDRDKTTPDKIKVKDSFHSDIIDAVLYAFKESPAFTYQPPIIKPKWGTPEWATDQVKEMEQQAVEHFERLEEAAKGFGEWKW